MYIYIYTYIYVAVTSNILFVFFECPGGRDALGGLPPPSPEY